MQRGSAVGHGEGIAHEPLLSGDVFLDKIERRGHQLFRLIDAVWIVRAIRPQLVAHDLLHLHMKKII